MTTRRTSWSARILLGATVAGAAGCGIGAAGVRSWKGRWRASHDESVRPLPGDELVGAPAMTETRAVTIAAPPACVWAAVQEIIPDDPHERGRSAAVDDGRALVLHRRGVSWATVLQRFPGSRTRLLQRVRSGRPLSRAARFAVFLVQRRKLLAIRLRAESLHRAEGCEAVESHVA